MFKCHKSLFKNVIYEKFRKWFYFFTCILRDYVPHESSKELKKIVIFKTQELVSFWGVKTHFGKLPMKWCIFRHLIVINIML